MRPVTGRSSRPTFAASEWAGGIGEGRTGVERLGVSSFAAGESVAWWIKGRLHTRQRA